MTRPVCIGQQTEKCFDMFGRARGPSVVSFAENVKGGQHVEDEDRRPAEEEEEHRKNK